MYWSKIVKNEFNNRFNKKFHHLIIFYQYLSFELQRSTKTGIKFNDLKNYAKNKKLNSKEEKDVLESTSLFWNKYFKNESYIPIQRFTSKLNEFLNDLKRSRYIKINFCKDNLITTDDIKMRKNTYEIIFEKLLTYNMQKNDANIILDAHDFSLSLDKYLDFITFDKNCYNGASSLNLAFNNVKTTIHY